MHIPCDSDICLPNNGYHMKFEQTGIHYFLRMTVHHMRVRMMQILIVDVRCSQNKYFFVCYDDSRWCVLVFK